MGGGLLQGVDESAGAVGADLTAGEGLKDGVEGLRDEVWAGCFGVVEIDLGWGGSSGGAAGEAQLAVEEAEGAGRDGGRLAATAVGFGVTADGVAGGPHAVFLSGKSESQRAQRRREDMEIASTDLVERAG